MSLSLQSIQSRASVLPNSRPVSFPSFVQDVLPRMGIHILPGPASQAYTLHFEDRQSLYLMSDVTQTSMITACVAGQLLRVPAASMLSRLLALNHQTTSNVTVAVGLDRPSGTIVVSSQHMLAGMHARLFKHILDAVLRQTRAVQQILASRIGHP